MREGCLRRILSAKRIEDVEAARCLEDRRAGDDRKDCEHHRNRRAPRGQTEEEDEYDEAEPGDDAESEAAIARTEDETCQDDQKLYPHHEDAFHSGGDAWRHGDRKRC